MALSPEMAYGASNRYTEQTVIGMGALKGAAAQIQGITDNQDGTHTITFMWKDNEGAAHTQNLTLKDGDNGEKGDKGEKGDRGESGEDGFSPIIEVAENSENSYKLRIITEYGEYITPNLRASGTATGDYTDLTNKPQINGVELDGKLSSDDLKIKGAEYTVTGETLVIK